MSNRNHDADCDGKREEREAEIVAGLQATADKAIVEARATTFDLPTLAAAVRDLLDTFASHQMESGVPDQLTNMVVGGPSLVRLSHLHFYLAANGYADKDAGPATGKPLPATVAMEARLREQMEAVRKAQGIVSH